MDVRQTGKTTDRGEKNMQMKFRSRLSLLFLSFALLLAIPAVAFADIITVNDADTLQASGDTSKQAGQTGSARFHLLATGPSDSNDPDPVGDCNANASNPVTVTANSTAKNAAGETITSPITFNSPGNVQITECDSTGTTASIEGAKTLEYTVTNSARVGDIITVSASASGGKQSGRGVYSTDTFKITVVAPPEQGTTLSVSPATGTYGGNTSLSATLNAAGTAVANKTVGFTVKGQSVGSAVTNSSGVATLPNVSLSGIDAGLHADAVSANYEGTGSGCSTNCFGPSDGKSALAVNQKELTGAFTASNKVYDGNSNATISGRSLTGKVGTDDVNLAGGTATFADKNVGNGKTVTGSGFTLTGTKADNYTLAANSLSTTANITKKDVAGSFTTSNKVYDGNTDATANDRSLSGVIQGDVVSLSGGTASFANKDVGTDKDVTLTGATLAGTDAGNYNLTSVGGAKANITAKELTGSFTASNKTYDGDTSASISGRSLGSGKVTGDGVSLTGGTATFDDKNVGTGKTVTGTGFSLSGAQAGNYSLSMNNTTTADITKANLTVKAKDASKTYGEAIDQRFNGVEYSGFVTGENEGVLGGNLSLSTNATATSPAGGDYYIRPSGLTSGNYDISFTDGKLTITKAQATITLSELNHTYDSTVKAATVTTSPDSPNKQLTVTYDGNAQAPKNAGSYRVVASLNDTNYQAQDAEGILVISKAALSVKAADKSKTYGDANPALTGTLSGVKGNDQITESYSTTATATSNVGNYPIAADVNGTQAVLANYDITRTNSTLTIGKRAIEMTAANKSKTYGDADPALTYSVTNGNLIQGDSLSGELTRQAGQDVGSYAIQQGTLSASGNYTLTFKNGTLTIDKAALTVAADNASKSYGDANPNFTGTLTGVKGNDQISASYSTTANASSNVGTYPIVAALSGDKLSNYTVTKEDGTLTITKRAITVTADAGQSKVYGQADPTLTYKLTSGNLIGTDGFNGALSRQAGETVAGSPYAIGVGTLTAGGNYNLTFVGDKFEITKRPIAVSADAQSKVYGQNDPALTYQVTGGSLVNSDSFTGALGRQAGETVAGSPYAINQGNLAANGNYNLTFSGANLTITKKQLTVTAQNADKIYGDATPAFEVIYDGFVNGDDKSNLGGALDFETAATPASPVGNYDVAPKGLTSGNYNIVFVKGSLKVQARPIAVTADAGQSKVYGQNDPALTYKLTGGSLVNSDSFRGVLGRDAGENVGTYAIRQGTLTAGSNYNLTFSGANFTITKATATITLSGLNHTYDSTAKAATVTTNPDSPNKQLTVTYNGSQQAPKDADSYDVVASLNDANYRADDVTGTLVISKAALSVKADDKGKTYGDANPALTGSLTGLKGSDQISASYSTTADRGSNAGTYPIAADVNGTQAVLANYSVTKTDGTLTISKRAITVSADPQTKVLGTVDPALTYKLSSGTLGFNDTLGGVLTGALERQAGETVAGSPYAIRQGTLAANGNYELTFKDGTLKIVYGNGSVGITQPINGGSTLSLTAAQTDPAFGDDNSRVKLGSTVPVKFTLKDANGAPVSNAVAKLTLKKADATPDPGVDEATSTAASTTGNLFRYDAMSGQYIFNLSTKAGYTNPSGTTVSFGPGTYTLTVVLDDGTTRSVNINIVK